MKIFEELSSRQLIKQLTSPKIENILNNSSCSFYCGFDPTADSLHIGSLLPLITMKRLMLAGHKPIVILGNATASIGDPSGKSLERNMLSQEIIDKNLETVHSQVSKILSGNPLILKNLDWFKDISFIDFLRNVGKNFSVNNMLTKDSVKSRIENQDQGISFTEFSYMLLQAEDFRHLFVNHNCVLEVGGQDNWPHILSGIELIRKTTGKEAFGMTFPLITKSDGSKFGKTEKGNIWLDPNKTSPFEFFQFFINVSDEDIGQLLNFFSLKSLEEISELKKEAKSNPEQRVCQNALAQELTLLVHGESGLNLALTQTKARFSQDNSIGNADLILENSNISLIDLLVDLKLSSSKTMARKEIIGGAIKLNGVKILNVSQLVSKDDFKNGRLLVSKGKSSHKIVENKE